MREVMHIGGVTVEVVRKDIKNVHLSVHPPEGRARIAAPPRVSLDTLRVFAISKLSWIRKQQERFSGQERETPREYLERESHFLWGRRYLLAVRESAGRAGVEVAGGRIVLKARPGDGMDRRAEIMERWYREQVRQAAGELVAKWEKLMGVQVRRIFVRRMKTRWGSCNPRAGSIRLNTELAKKPRECLEYVIVHEMTHLLEPRHNGRFIELMDHFLPKWQSARELLNSLPVRHETWTF